MSRGTLILIAATIALVVLVIGVRQLLARPLGAECRYDADCRSTICLRQNYEDVFNDSLHGRPTHPSVCTSRCEGDEDCPPTMACGAVSGGGAIWHGCVWRE
jgi:hypothetical protein